MSVAEFPEMITRLPDIDLKAPGVKGKLMQAGQQQVVFFEIEPTGVIAPHSHGAQWGIVVDGEIELTIGGQARIYTRGDSYYIPAGVEHSAKLKTKVKVIDVFDEPARYKPKA
ncbi:MAG: cupin domain-containing protein [Thermodesulfobacteriota bacterium]